MRPRIPELENVINFIKIKPVINVIGNTIRNAAIYGLNEKNLRLSTCFFKIKL
jgi:hypothetical protein